MDVGNVVDVESAMDFEGDIDVVVVVESVERNFENMYILTR